MRSLRNASALLLSLAFVAATSLPCPPERDPASVVPQSTVVKRSDPSDPSDHAEHAEHAGHADHSEHAARAESAPTVEPPIVQMPCPCGCGERDAPSPAGRLGPFVLTAGLDPLPAHRSVGVAPHAPIPGPAPFSAPDPVPI